MTNYWNAFEESGYGLIETDLEGVLTRVNTPASQLLGRLPQEIVGQHYRKFIVPYQLEEVHRVYQAVISTGQTQQGVEFPFPQHDGTFRLAEGAVTLARDSAGNPAGSIWILQDITERRQAETERKAQAAELQASAVTFEASTTALQQAKQAAERELEIGRRIQRYFLPDQLPQLPGWEIACHFKAAREVAGDFYDAFPLSGGKRIGLVVADVCDKGVGAALFMALFRSLIRAYAEQHYSLGWMDMLANDRPNIATTGKGSLGRRRALLSTGTIALKNAIDLTNHYITRNHGRTNMFATVFFGVLDPATGTMVYINGGQEPPILLDSHGIKQVLKITGPAVGLLPGLEFEIEQIEVEPGDILVSFTDGIIDANNPAREFFGEERVMSLLQEPAASAQALIDRFRTELEGHIGSAVQYDDITILAIRRNQEEGLR